MRRAVRDWWPAVLGLAIVIAVLLELPALVITALIVLYVAGLLLRSVVRFNRRRAAARAVIRAAVAEHYRRKSPALYAVLVPRQRRRRP